jgi:hypothetical protein
MAVRRRTHRFAPVRMGSPNKGREHTGAGSAVNRLGATLCHSGRRAILTIFSRLSENSRDSARIASAGREAKKPAARCSLDLATIREPPPLPARFRIPYCMKRDVRMTHQTDAAIAKELRPTRG